MKFIASTSSLSKQLQLINGVLSGSAVIPILEYFLFEVKEGTLTITGTDLENSMRGNLEVEAKEDGSVAIPAKLIIDILKSLPEQPITFSIDPDTYGIELTSDNGRYKIAGENPDDFPKFPELEESSSFQLPAKTLSKALTSSYFATGNDEVRPALAGVLFDMTENDLRFVATDGNKLVKYQRSDISVDSGEKFIIPKKALTLLKNSLPVDDSSVKVEFNKLNALFYFGSFQLICRLIDDKFPNYSAAIPDENPYQMTINRAEMLGSLKRISIFANKTTYQVELKIAGSELQLNAQDIDYSNEAHERLDAEFNGEDMDIGFSAKFLTEILGILETDDVHFLLSEPSKPGIVKPSKMEESEDLLMLLMPIVLKNQEESTEVAEE